MAYTLPAHFVIGAFNLQPRIIQDNRAFAQAMQELLEVGSATDNIRVNEIQAITDDAQHVNPANIADAIAHGMRFFDALAYFALPANQRPNITVSPMVLPAAERQSARIATKLFFVAFYLMTRGNVPNSDATTVGAVIPGMLANIYQMTMTPNQLCDDLCSFNLRRLNGRWIRYVNWTRLNVIPINRFGLGVAGYRNFAAFKLVPAEATVQHNVAITLQARNDAYATANAIATTPADWAIHPITRDPAVITTLGSLNGNLANLMIACYSDNTLNVMRQQGIIFNVPAYNPRFTNFMTWHPNMVTFLNDPIILI